MAPDTPHPSKKYYRKHREIRDEKGWRYVDIDNDDATHIIYDIRRYQYTTSIIFEFPGQQYHAENFERMLELMYDYGAIDAKADIRDGLRRVLGGPL